MSDYKPGTVAVATVRGVPNVRVMRSMNTYPNGLSSEGWFAAEIDGKLGWRWYADETGAVRDVRPLVVLDPGDARCAVTYLRLAAQYAMNKQAQGNAHRIADQIEAQTKPPKPEEPTGLGAVVKDADGSLMVRDPRATKPWSCGGVTRWSWDELDVPDESHILSRGVEVQP